MSIKSKKHAFKQFFTPDLDIRYGGWKTQLSNALRNIGRPVRRVSLAEAKRMRKEILFILGCNRSINEIEEGTWERISRYDTLGSNYWMFHPFVPTYYGLEYGRNKLIHHYISKMVQTRAEDYAETIFIINTRAWRRGMTPRFQPQFFPDNPKVMRFLWPLGVNCRSDRPLRPKDFNDTILYRGSLNLYLHFARLLGYKKIVLVGCEMDMATCFFEDLLEAQWMFQLEGYVYDKETRSKIPYGGVEASKGLHSMHTAIKAINEFVFKLEGIELYVFNQRSVFYPDVPLFTFQD